MPAKKITKHASLLYLCIFEKILRKLEKHLRRGLICERCEITNHSLLKDNKTKKQQKNHVRLVIVPTGVDVVAKLDDHQIYVLKYYQNL